MSKHKHSHRQSLTLALVLTGALGVYCPPVLAAGNIDAAPGSFLESTNQPSPAQGNSPNYPLSPGLANPNAQPPAAGYSPQNYGFGPPPGSLAPAAVNQNPAYNTQGMNNAGFNNAPPPNNMGYGQPAYNYPQGNLSSGYPQTQPAINQNPYAANNLPPSAFQASGQAAPYNAGFSQNNGPQQGAVSQNSLNEQTLDQELDQMTQGNSSTAANSSGASPKAQSAGGSGTASALAGIGTGLLRAATGVMAARSGYGYPRYGMGGYGMPGMGYGGMGGYGMPGMGYGGMGGYGMPGMGYGMGGMPYRGNLTNTLINTGLRMFAR